MVGVVDGDFVVVEVGEYFGSVEFGVVVVEVGEVLDGDDVGMVGLFFIEVGWS